MKLFLLIGIINGFLAVVLGAFGAHGLEGKISEKALKTWDKAVTYQMFHTVALLITALLMAKTQSGLLTGAGWLFFIGILLFSGSLYIYAPTGIKALAMITPFGGLTFLVGWALLGIAVVKYL
ncbi:DUF423 domain-containing protein [Thalassobacillus pellis]|uniref:DUF423 domain-containing protein n=1 Tax=Thalassobacillus pellis TaxID=748008 RepID=UPI001960B5F6|nr:DUF423 domain-containing protein [Thalassobacillus pellis]MBM7551825.1 uncharacterized membrane protein YgdD (TMEM256/DUF423 family) [Thalassobacillus pellis]